VLHTVVESEWTPNSVPEPVDADTEGPTLPVVPIGVVGDSIVHCEIVTALAADGRTTLDDMAAIAHTNW